MVKSKKIVRMVWAYGLVLFPVVLGSPLKYYWKGKCFQTDKKAGSKVKPGAPQIGERVKITQMCGRNKVE